MSRTTKAQLMNRFERVAAALNWDIKDKRWDNGKARIGSVSLEHNNVYGWNINQISNEAGAERRIKESCTAHEMWQWLDGAVYAITALEKLPDEELPHEPKSQQRDPFKAKS